MIKKGMKVNPNSADAKVIEFDYGTSEGQIGNLKDAPLKSITSPPYEQSITGGKSGIEWQDEWGKPSESRQPSQNITYGDSKDNIGNLKDKPLKSILSPPYQDSQGHPSLGSVNKDDWGKEGKDIVKRRGLSGEYGDADGQVGNLKSIMSPPYEESLPNGLDRKAAEQMVQAMYDKHGRTYSKEDFEYQVELILKRSNREYGETDGQIGKLKDKPLKSITSPPYGETLEGGGLAKNPPDTFRGVLKNFTQSQGEDEINIGNLKDKPLKSITSPPYGETGVGDWKTGRAEFQDWVINEIKTKGYVEWQGKRYNEAEWRAMNHGRIDGRTTKGVHKHPTDGYSDNPDNIGGLPDKPLKSIVSPPYAHSAAGENKTAQETRDLRHTQGGGLGQSLRQPNGYSTDVDNIGNLPDKPLKSVMSPPYGDAEKRDRSKEESNEREKGYPRGDHNISAGYQGSDDNIGKLDDKPLKSVMSPPYEGGGHHKGMLDSWGGKNTPVSDKTKDYHGYGNTEGQVEKAESYLEAMKKVYSEIAKVSDVLTVVVKNPTRAGKLRRLDLDTISILQDSGWRIHCQHRALLWEEYEQAEAFTQQDSWDVLLGRKKVKGRMSFFKRLAYQKGQPVASWEDILICVRK